MRILIAPDKFKETLGAAEVAQNIATGLRELLPRAEFDLCPVADGGEGTAAVICPARAGKWVTCSSHDALGRPIEARYVWLPIVRTAVIEMSETAGARHIALRERDPLRANTVGVGEMFLDAVSRGAEEIVMGLGGSITNDAGLGMARVLGYRFFNSSDVELRGGPTELVELARIQKNNLETGAPRLVTAATDVQNPLLGAHGATMTFGPQKGATPEQLEILENGLTRLADVVARDLKIDYRNVPGTGAAGGLGFGLMSFCGATIRSGFDLVADMIDLRAAIGRADVVVTGEGKLDSQTLEGKAPAGVARLARRMGKPVFAIVGTIDELPLVKALFDGVFLLARPPITLEEAIARTPELLQERGRELGRVLS